MLLFSGQPPAQLEVREIPEDWKGRLIRARRVNDKTELGGEAGHRHLLAHQHRASAKVSTDLVYPLGIRQTTTDALHTHAVESSSTEPASTGTADHHPPSFGLNAVILRERFVSRAPEGLIVGFLGSELPEGWRWCDGGDGTPDLRDRYIQLDGTAGKVGSPTHDHPADHRHSWATAENRDHPSYFGDPAPGPRPVQVAARIHRHDSAPETTSVGRTDPIANEPPAFGVRFMVASGSAAKVPKGAVIPFAGQGVPWGWEDAEARLGAGIVGRLLRAQWPGELPFKFSGTAVHQHRLSSIHEFLLVPVEGPAGDDLARPTPAPPAVPAAGHRHRVRVEEETETGPAEVWPLHVSLLLIVKS